MAPTVILCLLHRCLVILHALPSIPSPLYLDNHCCPWRLIKRLLVSIYHYKLLSHHHSPFLLVPPGFSLGTCLTILVYASVFSYIFAFTGRSDTPNREKTFFFRVVVDHLNIKVPCHEQTHHVFVSFGDCVVFLYVHLASPLLGCLSCYTQQYSNPYLLSQAFSIKKEKLVENTLQDVMTTTFRRFRQKCRWAAFDNKGTVAIPYVYSNINF